jgi:tetratricopeptide (TPR) repeat protein
LDGRLHGRHRPNRETPENRAVALRSRGNAYVGKGQPERAIQDYDQALRLTPGFAEAYYFRGETWPRDQSKGQRLSFGGVWETKRTELMICRRNLARMKKLHCDVWPSGSAMAWRPTIYAG